LMHGTALSILETVLAFDAILAWSPVAFGPTAETLD
jgi:hypothetical protein